MAGNIPNITPIPAEKSTASSTAHSGTAALLSASNFRIPITAPCATSTHEPDGTVTTYQFARTLPGPPVRMEVRSGDVVAFSMELVSRTGL